MTHTRESEIHAARVMLAQVPIFRAREEKYGHRSKYSQTLLQWAGNARRRAMAVRQAPAQGDLFA